MGLIILELKGRKPELPYFDPDYQGAYPEEAPFTIAELEEIYPTASAKSKKEEAYKEAAMQATFELQQGRAGYQALLKHILQVSVSDLKKNYKKLQVDFDLWKGESDAQPYIPEMVEAMKEKGLAYESEGALVVDIKEESDTKEIPPCMLLKSDGASLYTTTDLATIVERMKLYHPDEIVYVVDKRQEMHFIQVFRCARKCGLVEPDTKLTFLGFGTMNGKDGRPFKTREGGVMRLEYLLSDINEEMLKKVKNSRPMAEEEALDVAKVVGLSAVKYGDLSNQASKDYIFDVDRFTSSEGNTGPYILYTIVRIKSILKKYEETGGCADGALIRAFENENEKALMLLLTRFNSVMETAYEELAPHKVCAYIYEIANAFNKFYHETTILGTEDETLKKSRIQLLVLSKRVLETCIELLGFEAPERM
jgi:arginyl-tRNA synthetase